LHALGTPPAFILSQDQTLRKKYHLKRGVRLRKKMNDRAFTSYHFSIVKVLPNCEGKILTISSISVKSFSDKTADVF
jgi:hypothetical protein